MLSNRSLPAFCSVLLVLLLSLLNPGSTYSQFNYPTFPGPDLSFAGDGGFNGNEIRLIRTLPPSTGKAAVWHNDTHRTADGFVTAFTFRMVNRGGFSGGGEGLAFVIHAGGTGTIGTSGGGMGYNGIPDSLAIEFDSHLNTGFNDPDDNHVSIHPNGEGSEYSSIGSSSSIPNVHDGNIHTARIEYDGPSNAHQMRIFIDNALALTVTANLPTILPNLGPMARIGFTAGASTGAYENHDLLSWSFAPNVNVREVTFHQIVPSSVPIDSNPLIDDDGGTDDGLRIFPDRDSPSDDVDRSLIRVDASIGVNLVGRMVYFRTFDMDDPSPHSQVDLDAFGNDNRGTVEGGSGAGRISVPIGMETVCQIDTNWVACPTNASGIASVNFKVTMQPGDNFAIAASTNDDEIDAVIIDPANGHHLRSAAGSWLNSNCAAVEKVCRSHMLTVWRRLHIETDFMPTVDENHLDVKLRPGPPGGPPGVTIAAGETRVLDVYDPVTFDDLEASRFVEGRASVVGSPVSSMPVLDNTESKITVRNPYASPLVILWSDIIRVYDDDDFNDTNGANLIGDEGEAIPFPDNSRIPEGTLGDERSWNILALAYVRPVYDIGGGASQEFRTNIESFAEDDLTPIIAFDTRTAHPGIDEDPQFWTVYLLNAYQWPAANDGDEAYIPEFGFQEEPVEVGTTTAEGLASFVFVEQARPKECQVSFSNCKMSWITAREAARALGARRLDGGLLDLISDTLSTESLHRIRNQEYP